MAKTIPGACNLCKSLPNCFQTPMKLHLLVKIVVYFLRVLFINRLWHFEHAIWIMFVPFSNVLFRNANNESHKNLNLFCAIPRFDSFPLGLSYANISRCIDTPFNSSCLQSAFQNLLPFLTWKFLLKVHFADSRCLSQVQMLAMFVNHHQIVFKVLWKVNLLVEIVNKVLRVFYGEKFLHFEHHSDEFQHFFQTYCSEH